MQIIPLSEGSFSVDQSKKFIPYTDNSEKRPGSLLVEIQPFLVVVGADILLLDTGLGFEKDGELQLIRNIRDAGFDEHRVTKVLLSHLHKDHAGGIRSISGNGLAFPNARYYIQRDELNHATDPGSASYLREQFDILVNHEQCVLLDGNGTIDSHIHYELSGGHSRYHQVFRIEADGETVFFGGDEAPQLGQMKRRLSAKYDYDGKKAMEMRSLWWQQGQEEDWKFLFYHDMKNAIYPNL